MGRLSKLDSVLDLLIEEKQYKSNIKKPSSSFLSDELLTEHYNGHYLGYIDGYNQAKALLKTTKDHRSALLSLNFNYNGIILHDLYFDAINGSSDMPKDFIEIINHDFGSRDKFLEQLKSCLLASKNGWGLLGKNDLDDSLMLTAIDSHDLNCPVVAPILALDVWEHAYYLDYKTDKSKYIDELLDNLNWESVAKKVK